jgi:hypothetical protein
MHQQLGQSVVKKTSYSVIIIAHEYMNTWQIIYTTIKGFIAEHELYNFFCNTHREYTLKINAQFMFSKGSTL